MTCLTTPPPPTVVVFHPADPLGGFLFGCWEANNRRQTSKVHEKVGAWGGRRINVVLRDSSSWVDRRTGFLLGIGRLSRLAFLRTVKDLPIRENDEFAMYFRPRPRPPLSRQTLSFFSYSQMENTTVTYVIMHRRASQQSWDNFCSSFYSRNYSTNGGKWSTKQT